MTLNHLAVDGANLVWQHRHFIANLDVTDRNILDEVTAPAMRESRHPFGERPQHRRRFRDRKPFQGISTGQHQHDNRTGEILPEQNGGHDRDTSQVVGAKLSMQPAPDQTCDERDAAHDQRHEERRIHPGDRAAAAEAKPQVQADADDGKERDACIVAREEPDRAFAR